MPCNSDYMRANDYEERLSQVACLLDELNGQPQINKDHWRGYHPRVYCKAVDGDAMVAELCSRLQTLDVSKRSLEMQVWWRDHQQADKARLEAEVLKQKTDAEKAAALSKLTEYEKALLGLSKKGL